MKREFPFALLDDAAELARFQGWSEPVYRDFAAIQRGDLSAEDFDRKYGTTQAILVLDMTGFTVTTSWVGSLEGLLRIYDAQKVCLPALLESQARAIHTFADDIVALFEGPAQALDAAFHIHERIEAWNESSLSGDNPPYCGIGIGYGHVYAIGPNGAMGDEMNRASKLGEDTARGGETLLTESAFRALEGRADATFEAQRHDDLIFPYWRASAAG